MFLVSHGKRPGAGIQCHSYSSYIADFDMVSFSSIIQKVLKFLKTYQATAILYLRGLLASEYNVDLTSIDWVTEFEEEIPFETPTDIRLSRAPKGSAIPVPTSNVKLNKYGNLPGGQSRIKRLLKRSRVFQGTINGLAGIRLRSKRGRQRAGTYGAKGKLTGLKLLVAYEPKTSYQPRYDFYGIGQRSVKSNITGEMNKAITKTLASAK